MIHQILTEKQSVEHTKIHGVCQATIEFESREGFIHHEGFRHASYVKFHLDKPGDFVSLHQALDVEIKLDPNGIRESPKYCILNSLCFL